MVGQFLLVWRAGIPTNWLLLLFLQVMALCQAPFLMDDPHVNLLFPADAIARAKHYLAMTSGGVGKSGLCGAVYVAAPCLNAITTAALALSQDYTLYTGQ